MPERFFTRFFEDPFFLKLLKRHQIKLIVYDEITQTLVQWIR